MEFTTEYAATLSEEAAEPAETLRANLEITLRSLLATASVCARMYDWRITTAMRGMTDAERPFQVFGDTFPQAPPFPTRTKEKADEDHAGPNSYGREHSDGVDKVRLRTEKLAAQALANTWQETGMPIAAAALQNFLNNDGKPTTVNVDRLLHDVPTFRAEAADFARSTLKHAQESMPAGYNGPVAFVSDWAPVEHGPSHTGHPDWFDTLGSFSSQTSGVAMPTGDGHYAVAARTSVYDYYNFSNTDPKFSWLNDLHRYGWAQNYDASGVSSVQNSTWP